MPVTLDATGRAFLDRDGRAFRHVREPALFVLTEANFTGLILACIEADFGGDAFAEQFK